MSEKCPQCGRADGTLRARQAHEGDPPAPEAAPPPPPPEPPAADGPAGRELRGGAKAGLAVCAALAVMSLVQTSTEDLSGYDESYAAGARLGWTLWLVIGALFWVFGRRKPRVQAAPQLEWLAGAKAVWTRRMQVWEHAWFCTHCRVGFWPAGVLRADFPASPPVPADAFPTMVATMAERAYGSEAAFYTGAEK